MRLVDLLDPTVAPSWSGNPDLEVTGLAYDSRKVCPGDLFFALPGQHHDGSAFAMQALERGAAAVICEAELASPASTQIRVTDARLTMAAAACRFHGHPSRALKVVAVTGTNGKTTTTYLLEAVFRAAGLRAGVIGTTGIRIDGESRPSAFTTPEAPELQGTLAEMRDRGVQAVAIEASSHALAQRRTWGLECDACVFTNLTQDHLDYHGTMDEYLDAKLRLFDGRNGARAKRATAVVSADDASGERVIAAARSNGSPTLRYGLDPGASGAGPLPEFAIHDIALNSTGVAMRLEVSGAAAGASAGAAGSHAIQLPLLGRYNASNAAAAFAAACALGLDADPIRRGLEATPGVPGRLERIDVGQPFSVVVDYAHTPDALERSLAACREHATGQVLAVFGCGGDRDRGKRPLMGAIAERLADRCWITNDNPRSEPPAAIARDIAAGMSRSPRIVLDRQDAIAEAIATAAAHDIVIIAGKGHETTQTVGERVLPFDDREVARSILRARAGTGR